MRRNIILVTGPFAGGKTELIVHLKTVFDSRGILFEPTPVSDSQYVVAAVERDHQETGGIHHIHQEGDAPAPHAYDAPTEPLTFINVSPQMQQWMFENFFEDLSRPRDPGTHVFAELAGGRNATSSELLTARNDYSYESIAHEFRHGTYATGWIERVALIVHIQTDYTLRDYLNEERRDGAFTLGQDTKGERSRPLPQPVMLFTRDDDFEFMERYLHAEHGLDGRVVTVKNDGTPTFFETATRTVLERLPVNVKEGPQRGLGERPASTQRRDRR